MADDVKLQGLFREAAHVAHQEWLTSGDGEINHLSDYIADACLVAMVESQVEEEMGEPEDDLLEDAHGYTRADLLFGGNWK